MGFRQGAFAKVWRVYDVTNGATIQFPNGNSMTYPPGNYSIAQISVSKRQKDENGNLIEPPSYITEFQNNFVRLVGNAHTAMQKLDVPDSGLTIQISSCDVTNKWVEKDQKEYTNFVIFGFEVPNDNGGRKSNNHGNNKPTTKPNDGFMNVPDGTDEELPFN